jgi:hypothetical protein
MLLDGPASSSGRQEVEQKEEPGLRHLDETERKVKGEGSEAGKKAGQRARTKPEPMPRIATEIEEKRDQG